MDPHPHPALWAERNERLWLDGVVLATCGIRRPELAYEDTQSCLLFLANFPEKVYNLRHSPAHHHKGGWILCKEFSSSSRS